MTDVMNVFMIPYQILFRSVNLVVPFQLSHRQVNVHWSTQKSHARSISRALVIRGVVEWLTRSKSQSDYITGLILPEKRS